MERIVYISAVGHTHELYPDDIACATAEEAIKVIEDMGGEVISVYS